MPVRSNLLVEAVHARACVRRAIPGCTQILLTGKAILFIRDYCQDRTWPVGDDLLAQAGGTPREARPSFGAKR